MQESIATNRQLVNVKRAAELTGSSRSFFKKLLKNGDLQRYKVGRCTYLDFREFQQLAKVE